MAKIYPEGYHTTPKKKKKKMQSPAPMQKAPPSKPVQGAGNMPLNDVDKVPTKEEFDAMTPEQQAAQKKKAMMQNLNLTPEEKAAKKAMERKNIFKNMGGPAVSSAKKAVDMARGGMATANKYDKNKKERSREADMQSGELFFDKRPTPKQEPTEDQTDYDISDPAGFNKGGMAKKMNMGGMAKASYSKGSKVRGYGMARGGKACKMR